MRCRCFLLLLVICCSAISSIVAQNDFIDNQGPVYDRSDKSDQHFKYLFCWDGHHYLRTGDDKNQTIIRVDEDDQVAKTISLPSDFHGKQAYFERFLEMPSGVYGYFLVPFRKQGELILAIAPFDGERFGALREIYRHEFVKIPAVFRETYPFVSRSWTDSPKTRRFLKQSPDGTKLAYISYQTPIGYQGIKKRHGLHVAIFNDEFVVQENIFITDYSPDKGSVVDAVVDNQGRIWTTQRKSMQRGDWGARLNGRYLPFYEYFPARLNTEIEIMNLPLGTGKAANNLFYSWDETRQFYRITGTYTTSESAHEFSGTYFATVSDIGISRIEINPVATDMLDRSIIRVRPHVDKKPKKNLLSESRQIGSYLKLQKVNYNKDSTISWLYEWQYVFAATRNSSYDRITGSYLENSYTYQVKDIFYFIQTDTAGRIINHRIHDKFYSSPLVSTPATLIFNKNDYWHLIYPRMVLPANEEKLKKTTVVNSRLEYLIIDSKGEQKESNVLMNDVARFYYFNHPLAMTNGSILFAKLERNSYSLGSYKAK